MGKELTDVAAAVSATAKSATSLTSDPEHPTSVATPKTIIVRSRVFFM